MKFTGQRVAAMQGNSITLQHGDASMFKLGDRLAFAVSEYTVPRVGELTIQHVDNSSGLLRFGTDVRSAIPTLADSDCIFIVSEAPMSDYELDHAALVSYLLSAVRRRDWHAVSDAANDLRVLDAKGAK